MTSTGLLLLGTRCHITMGDLDLDVTKVATMNRMGKQCMLLLLVTAVLYVRRILHILEVLHWCSI